MTQFYTPLKSTDTVNHTALNSRLTELSDAIDGVLDGSEAQPSPDILDFTNAQHDHEDAAGGGQLTVAAFNSGDADVSYAVTADGDGGAELRQIVNNFIGLSDTPNSYSGIANQALRVNSGETGLIACREKASVVLDENADYETTSTSFVDVDADVLVLTIDTTGGDILVGFSGTAYNGNANESIYFDIDVDGGRVAGDDGILTTERVIMPIPLMWLVTGLSAGPHTIKLQWKVTSAGGTGLLYAGEDNPSGGLHPQFFGWEVA